jgi:hypothetical protein
MRGDRREELRAAAAFLDLDLIDVAMADGTTVEGRDA